MPQSKPRNILLYMKVMSESRICHLPIIIETNTLDEGVAVAKEFVKSVEAAYHPIETKGPFDKEEHPEQWNELRRYLRNLTTNYQYAFELRQTAEVTPQGVAESDYKPDHNFYANPFKIFLYIDGHPDLKLAQRGLKLPILPKQCNILAFKVSVDSVQEEESPPTIT